MPRVVAAVRLIPTRPVSRSHAIGRGMFASPERENDRISPRRHEGHEERQFNHRDTEVTERTGDKAPTSRRTPQNCTTETQRSQRERLQPRQSQIAFAAAANAIGVFPLRTRGRRVNASPQADDRKQGRLRHWKRQRLRPGHYQVASSLRFGSGDTAPLIRQGRGDEGGRSPNELCRSARSRGAALQKGRRNGTERTSQPRKRAGQAVVFNDRNRDGRATNDQERTRRWPRGSAALRNRSGRHSGSAGASPSIHPILHHAITPVFQHDNVSEFQSSVDSLSPVRRAKCAGL
jgi:hypothetical protein